MSPFSDSSGLASLLALTPPWAWAPPWAPPSFLSPGLGLEVGSTQLSEGWPSAWLEAGSFEPGFLGEEDGEPKELVQATMSSSRRTCATARSSV